MKEDDLHQLILEVLDGRASEERQHELSELLARDPEVVELYCRYSGMDSALMRLAIGRRELELMPKAAGKKRWVIGGGLLAAAAAVVLALVLIRPWGAKTPEGVAVLQQEADAVVEIEQGGGWKGMRGTDVGAGSRLRLAQGSVELKLANGVLAQLEAPAEWLVTSKDRVEIVRGNARFSVPSEAVSFEALGPQLLVQAPQGRFELQVEAGQPDELEVREGQVLASHRGATTGDSSLILPAGAVVVATPKNTVEAVAIHKSGLNSPTPGVPGRLHWSFDQKLAAGWPAQGDPDNVQEAFSRPVQSQPTIIDGPKGKAIQLAPGQVVATRWPGILDAQARTVAAWIRIPANVPDALIPMSIVFWGREGDDLAMMKWRIGLNPERYEEGGVKGALRCEWGHGRVIGTQDLRDGRWHHVAVVYEGGNSPDTPRLVRLYVDGKAETVSSSRPQYIQTQPAAPLQFGGRDGVVDLDEVYVFEGALGADQVGALSRLEKLPGE